MPPEEVFALLGEWPDSTAQEFIEMMKKHGNFYFTVAKNTVRSGLIPDGFERLREVRYAHEHCLARSCDIAIFGNNGMMGPIKSSHLKKLYDESVLVIWTPPGVDEDLPPQEKMIPGIVQIAGSLDLLASVCAYICLK